MYVYIVCVCLDDVLLTNTVSDFKIYSGGRVITIAGDSFASVQSIVFHLSKENFTFNSSVGNSFTVSGHV